MTRCKQGGRKLTTVHKRYVSWKEMDEYVDAHGYELVAPRMLAAGDDVFVRVDKYRDEGGREASVLWSATCEGCDTNVNTGTLQYMLNYTCMAKYVLYPQRHTSLAYFGGHCVSAKDTDVRLYKRVARNDIFHATSKYM